LRAGKRRRKEVGGGLRSLEAKGRRGSLTHFSLRERRKGFSRRATGGKKKGGELILPWHASRRGGGKRKKIEERELQFSKKKERGKRRPGRRGRSSWFTPLTNGRKGKRGGKGKGQNRRLLRGEKRERLLFFLLHSAGARKRKKKQVNASQNGGERKG